MIVTTRMFATAALLGLSGVVTACDTTPVLEQQESSNNRTDPAARVEAIRARLPNHRVVEGRSSAGDTEAMWTAYFHGAVLEYIRETSNQGEYGKADNEYWFHDGILFAYTSRGTRTITDPSRPRGTEQVTLHLIFHAAGELAHESKMIDGRSAPIQSTEVAGARARAAFLVREAKRIPEETVVPAPTFRLRSSRSGRMVLVAGNLRFIPCGGQGDGIALQDLPGGEGEALLRQLGGEKNGITVIVRIDRNRLQEIRYGGMEGPSCDRLPPEGDVEARGNEPFWTVNVDGAVTLLRTPGEPDGVRFAEGVWTRTDGTHFHYQSRRQHADRTESLTLQLTEEHCFDSMSGARYPFRATLIRDGSRMDGCGLEGRGSGQAIGAR